METVLVKIEKDTHDCLKHYAQQKGMSVDAAADYLLTRDMILFMDGCGAGLDRASTAVRRMRIKDATPATTE